MSCGCRQTSVVGNSRRYSNSYSTIIVTTAKILQCEVKSHLLVSHAQAPVWPQRWPPPESDFLAHSRTHPHHPGKPPLCDYSRPPRHPLPKQERLCAPV